MIVSEIPIGVGTWLPDVEDEPVFPSINSKSFALITSAGRSYQYKSRRMDCRTTGVSSNVGTMEWLVTRAASNSSISSSSRECSRSMYTVITFQTV